MRGLVSDLIFGSVDTFAKRPCLSWEGDHYDYQSLVRQVAAFAHGLVSLGIEAHERVGIYLPKRPESVIAMFGAAAAGCVFVPINPLLRPGQVRHILHDCNVRVLVTEQRRRADLVGVIAESSDLHHIVELDAVATAGPAGCTNVSVHSWKDLLQSPRDRALHRVIDIDGAAIFYTSGSTGRPKGVVLSHANIVAGAESVSQYLHNRPEDRLLAVLPLSFDYGFSQLSTAFRVGASVVLMEYLLPQDIPLKVGNEGITGLAGVPPLWNRLADLDWPRAAQDSLRYVTNSGGMMPTETLQKLRRSLPRTQPYLMYGLTEAFRSTYLLPAELDSRPNSIGKAIPNAEVMVVRPDGTVCADDETGELVHRGALVALGYWNDPVTTAERFRPIGISGWAPGRAETAVWSGDLVKRDADGFFYFIGRGDDLIKTSGYRISPVEVEEILFATGLVSAAVALGVPDRRLGEVIATVVVPAPNTPADSDALRSACKLSLPIYMVPSIIEWRSELPRNPNGKYDRAALRRELISRNDAVSV